MIKLETAHIEEVRGIRTLDIDFNRTNFVVSGPNGSGKSGVIDAIEFALTGDIRRLAGKGTKQLSIKEHGPHVDKAKFPDAAFVTIKVYFPDLKKSGSITRKISAPSKPVIEPPEPDIIKAFEDVADHPEITLSRREVLRFIITEPATRSQDIQIILKLDGIGDTRAALNTAHNSLRRIRGQAETGKGQARDTLVRHLQIAKFEADSLLAAVNEKRKALELPEIQKLEADTKLDAGVTEGAKAQEINKASALRDLKAVSDAIAAINGVGQKEAAAILQGLAALEADPKLLDTLQRRSLIEKGLSLVEGPECPLCDREWQDESELRAHLRDKLARSEEAAKIRAALLKAGEELGREVSKVGAMLDTAGKYATVEGEAERATALSEWRRDLEQLRTSLGSIDGITGLKARLQATWHDMPANIPNAVADITAKIHAKPDQSVKVAAQTFLTTAQMRINDYRTASKELVAAERSAEAAKTAYDAYCRVMEEELNKLYEDVQEDFCSFYKQINDGDEDEFAAKLTPAEGKLDFEVNFYGRGLFPPAAFHSEGHQDGMGVCLYLALMKRLLGDRFTFALLDDVVMSVDVDHRRQFCKLLKDQFRNTQFVITTHDRLWARQMASAGLVTSKTSLVFQNWSVDTGPVVESDEGIWPEIEAAIAKGKISDAAGMLRRHIEYVMPQLADSLGAKAVFKADGSYDAGDLQPSAIGRLRELLAKAAESANSWNNEAQKKAVADHKSRVSEACTLKGEEDWAINKAVHFNEWANFGKKDFEPVVAAFKKLISEFRCATCDSYVYISPRGPKRPQAAMPVLQHAR
jgi:recombinational DNA repair ATPase RecF